MLIKLISQKNVVFKVSVSLSAIFHKTEKIFWRIFFFFKYCNIKKLQIQLHSNLSIGRPVFLSLLFVAKLITMLKHDPGSTEFTLLSTAKLQFAGTTQV